MVIINQDVALQRKGLTMSVSLSCPPTGIWNWILETAGFFHSLGVIFLRRVQPKDLGLHYISIPEVNISRTARIMLFSLHCVGERGSYILEGARCAHRKGKKKGDLSYRRWISSVGRRRPIPLPQPRAPGPSAVNVFSEPSVLNSQSQHRYHLLEEAILPWHSLSHSFYFLL